MITDKSSLPERLMYISAQFTYAAMYHRRGQFEKRDEHIDDAIKEINDLPGRRIH